METLAVNNSQPSKRQNAKAYTAGAAIALTPSAYLAYDALTKPNENSMKKLGQAMSAFMPEVDTFENIKSFAEKALDETGLRSKGIKIKYINDSNIKEITEELMKTEGKNPISKNSLEKFMSMFKHGLNAGYFPTKKEIYIGEKGAYSSVFHEMGHALNHNSSKIWKIAQKSRLFLTPFGVPAAGLVLFGLGLFHKVKPEQDGVQKSKWEKTKDFARNHSGKIAFATMIPMMAEELAASSKGLKIAQKYLNPAQLSKLKGNYGKAFSTYALIGTILPAAIGLANIAADKIQNKKA